MADRNKLSILKGKRISGIRAQKNHGGTYNGYLEFFDKGGRRLFTVKPDELFDGNGNFFDLDLEPYNE